MLRETDLKFSQKLLDWYDYHHRCLPWRVDPSARRQGQKPEPYHVWLSEIMLQQTTVATVKSYFNKFITLWPDMKALHRASLEDVLKGWAGLGYYARARNLKATADRIARNHFGIFPTDYKTLRALPGIGDYTASAIMAIAFDKPYAVVDGNVERIIARMFAFDISKPALKKPVHAKMQLLTPSEHPGDFVQAMMDLGATVCRPVRPICSACPLEKDCVAARRDEAEYFPPKAIKKPKKLRTGIAFIIRSRTGKILLQKRPAKGLMAQMSEIPNYFSEKQDKQAVELAPFKGNWHYQGEITHVFTHFRLEMAVYLLTDMEEENFKNRWWVAEGSLAREALPSVMKKALLLVCPDAFGEERRG